MVYVKRSNKRNLKSKTLSRKNIYTKTSAKSQSNQIVALTKRVSALSKRNRLELLRYPVGVSTTNQTFDSSALSAIQFTQLVNMNAFCKGSWTHLRKFAMHGILSYADNDSTATPRPSGISQAATARLIIWQNLRSNSTGMTLDDILSIGSVGADYQMNTVRPLRDGVTSVAKILYHRVFNISHQRPQVPFKVNISKLLNYHREDNASFAYGRGSIFIGWVTSGLEWTPGGYIETIHLVQQPTVFYHEEQ